uniref:Myb2 n=1 Tax=Arundo donax TaxID=35708 RepID=A0A0A9GJH9_ARUDO
MLPVRRMRIMNLMMTRGSCGLVKLIQTLSLNLLVLILSIWMKTKRRCFLRQGLD